MLILAMTVWGAWPQKTKASGDDLPKTSVKTMSLDNLKRIENDLKTSLRALDLKLISLWEQQETLRTRWINQHGQGSESMQGYPDMRHLIEPVITKRDMIKGLLRKVEEELERQKSQESKPITPPTVWEAWPEKPKASGGAAPKTSVKTMPPDELKTKLKALNLKLASLSEQQATLLKETPPRIIVTYPDLRQAMEKVRDADVAGISKDQAKRCKSAIILLNVAGCWMAFSNDLL